MGMPVTDKAEADRIIRELEAEVERLEECFDALKLEWKDLGDENDALKEDKEALVEALVSEGVERAADVRRLEEEVELRTAGNAAFVEFIADITEANWDCTDQKCGRDPGFVCELCQRQIELMKSDHPG